jgi:hypothetical protein
MAGPYLSLDRPPHHAQWLDRFSACHDLFIGHAKLHSPAIRRDSKPCHTAVARGWPRLGKAEFNKSFKSFSADIPRELSLDQEGPAIGAEYMQRFRLARSQHSAHGFLPVLARGLVFDPSAVSIRRRIASARVGKSDCWRRQLSMSSIISSSSRISNRSVFGGIDLSVCYVQYTYCT